MKGRISALSLIFLVSSSLRHFTTNERFLNYFFYGINLI